MKRLIKEILLITIIASAIAFAYNIFSSKSLPWVYKPKEIAIVNDSDLLINTDSAIDDTNSIVKPNTDIDTIITATDNEQAPKSDIDTLKILTEQTEITASEEESQNKSNNDELKTLKYEQVLANLNNTDFFFVDARHKEEWEKAHIGNAINITPPYDDDLETYFKKLYLLPHNKIIVVYCTGGSCEASHRVASDLKAIGYERVFLYSGGWDDWTKKRGN